MSSPAMLATGARRRQTKTGGETVSLGHLPSFPSAPHFQQNLWKTLLKNARRVAVSATQSHVLPLCTILGHHATSPRSQSRSCNRRRRPAPSRRLHWNDATSSRSTTETTKITERKACLACGVTESASAGPARGSRAGLRAARRAHEPHSESRGLVCAACRTHHGPAARSRLTSAPLRARLRRRAHRIPHFRLLETGYLHAAGTQSTRFPFVFLCDLRDLRG